MNFPSPFKLGWRARLTELLGTLQHWPWLDTLRTLRQRFREDRLGLTAGSLTFTTLISLVPLVTVMLALFTAFPMFYKFQDALQKYFLQALVPDTIARPVLGALTQFASKANRLGSVGLVILVFTAVALMLTIDRTLNNIWRVPKPRPIAQRVLVYWAAVTLGPLLLGVSLTFTSYAISASKGFVTDLPGGVSFLLSTLQFLLLSAAMAGLFHYVPNTNVQWRHALAGGVFVSAGFELAKRGLGWYLSSVPTYTNVYGAFATVPILLIWIYLGWVIVLLGAVMAAYAPSLQMRVVRRPNVPGYRFQLVVGMLRELAQARTLSTHGLSAEQLSETMRTDPLQIEPLLDTLVAIDWVGRLDEEGGARYVLLCAPEATPAQPLLARVLLDPAPSLHGFWQQAGFAEMTLQDLIKN
ncbi:MAG: YihY family inner membrane protein [Cytophagales bacterium]|nr:YihY family inner membrane protein [Rhizobacter sp.]